MGQITGGSVSVYDSSATGVPFNLQPVGHFDQNGLLQGTSTNPLSVYDAYQAPTVVNWTSGTTVNTAATVTTNGYDTVIVTIAPPGTMTAGQVTFEVYDGSNWIPVKSPRTDSYITESVFIITSSVGTHAWQIPVAGFPQFRARLSTVITGSGTCPITTIVSSAPDTSIVTVGLDPSQPLPVGSNIIGSISGATGSVSVTPTVSAGAYASGYCMGGLISLTNATRTIGSGMIQSVACSFASGVEPTLDIVFFDANPTSSTFTNAAQIVVAAADSAKIVGVVHLGDWTLLAASTISFGQAQQQSMPFALASGTTLYAAVIARSTVTPGSTSDLTVKIRILQD